MKKRLFAMLGLALVSGMMLTGCTNSSEDSVGSMQDSSPESGSVSILSSEVNSAENDSSSEAEGLSSQTAELTVQFGDEGDSLPCIFTTMIQRRQL